MEQAEIEQDAAHAAASPDDAIAELATVDIERLLAQANVERSSGEEGLDPSPLPDEPQPAKAPLAENTSAQPKPSSGAAATPPEAAPKPPTVKASHAVAAAEQNPPPAQPDSADDAAKDIVHTAPDAAGDKASRETEDRTPIYLLPLEWIDRPFAAIPDPIRSLLGQVAVLTLLHAAGVLIYVLKFRHK